MHLESLALLGPGSTGSDPGAAAETGDGAGGKHPQLPTELAGLLKASEKWSLFPWWHGLPHLVTSDWMLPSTRPSARGHQTKAGAAWLGYLLQLVLLQHLSLSSGGFQLPNICFMWVLRSPRGPSWSLMLPWLCSRAVPPGPPAGQGWGSDTQV